MAEKTSKAEKATPKSTETSDGSVKAGTSHLTSTPNEDLDVAPDTDKTSISARDLRG